MDQKTLNAFIAQRLPDHALEQVFYKDESIYRRDVDRIFMRSWVYAGHTSEIPKRGDYFLFNLADESVIIIRSEADEISTLINVCRHRGSRVCIKSSGQTFRLTCPYHGWTYALNGELRGAAHMDDKFDKSSKNLKSVHMRILEGMIYINFAENPCPFDPIVKDLEEVLKPYALGSAKVADRKKYFINANWKLSLENYTECYHCAPAHPEYSRGHGLTLGKEKMETLLDDVMARASACGLSKKYIDNSYPYGEEFGSGRAYTRYPMLRGHVTGSEDGKSVAPLMGSIKDYDGGCTDFQVGPITFALAYCDHVVIYRFIPLSAHTSECDITWLVNGAAADGIDYDKSKLTWLWDVTTEADKFIIEHNQLGVNSRYYEPGPYSEMEAFTDQFVSWYLECLGS
jgi:Rieske 2Fe-2S family protein